MSDFTKTVIVDLDRDEVTGQYYKTIGGATGYLNGIGGGTIIVEAGTYNISSMIEVPSNTTIIGRGGVEIAVSEDVPAFRNKHYGSTPYYDSNIVLSGLKIVVKMKPTPPTLYTSQVIAMKNVSNSVFEKLIITADPSQRGDDVYNPANCAMYFQGEYSTGDTLNCSHNTISQCIINQMHVGIKFNNYCFKNSIRNNIISDCSEGIFLILSDNNTIQGNIVKKSFGNPNIMIEKCNELIISGNISAETTGYYSGGVVVSHGLYLSGTKRCVIQGNVMAENGQHGIKPRYTADLTSDQYNTIGGNVCCHNGRGVPGYTEDGTGILLQGKTEYHAVMGNTSYNNSENGIWVQDQTSDTYPAVHNLVLGNAAVCHSTPGSDAPISVPDTTNNLCPAGKNIAYTLP